MKRFKGYLRILLFILICFVFQDINAQFSKTHYIPPIATTGSGPSSPQTQHLYISTPNETPFNVIINPIGGTPITVQVSNANPYEYYVGAGIDTNFIVQTNLSGQNLTDKGFIIEAEDLVYVSVRLFTSAQLYQAGGIVSKGLAALGEEFRVGTFRNLGNLTGGQSQYLNFISVLATQDNTTVNFSNFGNGVTLINNAATTNIQLNAGESYVISASPYTNSNNAEGFIGVLVESDKPIAVNCGSITGSNANLDDGDYGQDVGIDQVAPVERIGSEYIFVRGVGPDEIERPLIVAHEDNTEVYVNGLLYTTLANGGDFVSIEGSYYGVSYPADGNEGPPVGQSSNMYVNTSNPVFAFQVIGGQRPGGSGGYSGIPNQGLFFVPPINCQTPKIVDNIPFINQIGTESFSGVVTLITENGSTVLINDLDISNYNTTVQAVIGNNDFVSYTIEGLTGNVSVESTSQVYVASFGGYDYATFGGYYSGFAFKPEILLQTITVEDNSCIPNLTLSLNNISTYDQYQWYYNGDPIAGANSINYTPSEPGYYQISGSIENCPGAVVSENIPVSACPNDFDNDGVNDNIDIDNDNDGILDCFESLGDKLIDLTGDTGGSIEGLYNYTFGGEGSDIATAMWLGDTIGNWETYCPTPYLDSDNIQQDGYISTSITFDSEISLVFSYSCITDINTGLPIDCNTMDNEEWFSLKVPYDKTITLLDPDDQILIDTNFDGIFESGITNFSNFEIRFKINGTSLNSVDSTFKFYTHLTDFFEMTHFNSSDTVNKAVFNVTATCVPIDSDGDLVVDAKDSDSDNDGILDIIESSGSNYQPISNIDANGDGYDDIFSFESTPIDSDGDEILDYLDLDSDNDGIYDSQESGATITDADLDGIIDISSGNIGNNGLFDSIETSIDSGITNFSVSDTDEDGLYNYIDLDSDEDNCSDVIEAGYSDDNADDLLGNDTVTVDSNGLVNNASDGYSTPSSDYIINGTIVIDEQPQESVLTCENSSFQLSISSTTIDFYQWESSSDGVNWNILEDNDYYNGVNSSTLQILTTPLNFNNMIFRALVDREGNGCIIYSSESTIAVDLVPEVIVPTALEECDDDYNGITSFNLTDKDIEILNGQTGITVSYHELQEDAESGANPITYPYLNTTADGQTLYVRLEDDATACYATTTLELIVNPIPEVIIPPVYEVCDDDYDNVGTFDLTSLDDTILNGQTGMSVSYYESQEDADAGTNVLSTPFNNTVLSAQEIIVRLENNTTGCYATTTQGLIVNSLAVIEVTDYELCDYINSGDMVEVFDITTKNDEIINGQDVTLSYFSSLSDSQNNTNALSNAELTSYSNSFAVSEEIFIRLEQNATGCLTFGSFNVTVNPLPNVILNTDLVQCDIDDVQDGISIYNLEEAAGNLVIGDDPDNYVLTFHLSQADLDNNENAIPNPTSFVNATPLQNIYCRVENIATTCYTTSYFYLETIFNPIPDDAGLIVCDNSEMNGNDYDGLGLFTLSDADDYVLSLIVANPNNDIDDPSDLSVAYYLNETDAHLELNQLPNNYISEVPWQQTISLRVENENDCFGISTMLLEVRPIPQYNEVPDEVLCTDTPGVIDVDLTDYNTQVLGAQTPGEVIITYHNSQLDADYGTNALSSPYTVNNQETIYVRVEVEDNDPFSTSCFISNINFTLTVEPKPVFIAPTPLIVCDDDDPDGLTTMDVSVKTEGIAAGIVENVITYHESQEDADNDVNPIVNTTAYTNTSNPQTLYVRIIDDMTAITGCYSTTTLELIVESPPAVVNPSNLEYCDADADGFGVFTLTDADAEIAGNLQNLVISYHETQADAENNLNAIESPYNNIVAYQQPIYVRVEDTTITTDCFSYIELLIVVNDVPQIATDPDPLEVCDDDADGFALFDLSLSDESVLNGLNPSDFNITYYESAENANNATNPILTPFAYTNITEDTQQVWVHVENATTGCYNTVSLTLIVNELPVLIQPLPLELCDDNNTGDEVEEFTLEDSIDQVLDAQTGISITFYETQENADNANTSNAQTIYLRGKNDITGCYSTITLDLRVNPIPSPATPEPIEVCDEDNDGFTFFDIETYEVDIINGELDITISYYETFANAQNAVEPLVSPYFNIVPDSQVIFVRAENDLTGCFNIVEQELVTLPSPVLPITIEDIIVCDDDYDEITVFDLTQRDDDILGDQTTVDFELTYHETLEDTQTGDNPIINTSSYINLSNPQTIYVRLEDLNNGCVSIGEFDLIVALPPVIVQPTPLEECDDEVADEITVFDLTLKDDEITGGNASWTVTYYETAEDAQNTTYPIETPEAYTNTSVAGNQANPQTLFVSVVNTEGCAAYTTLTIRVLPNPTPSTDAPNIKACDYDNPGDQIEVFDITFYEAYIINGEPGVSIAYYETLEEAETATNPIVDGTAYTNTNITLGQQTIYVRVTNDTTGCFTIVTFDIVVNPLPDFSTVTDYIACEINTDGFYEFDLDAVTAQVLGSQDPENFTVTYHQTPEDADNGENALVSPYTNLTNPQQLFVNITNNLTTCSIAVPSFSIEVQEGAAANGDGVPIEYIICDNTGENDGIDQFDLTTLTEQVLDGQDATNFTVTYYANAEDAEAGVNPLPSVYENTSNPQVIYIRVDNDTTAASLCYDTTQATLSVNLLPEFTLPESYMACINLNGTELVGPTVMEIDLPSSEYSFEWFDPDGNLAATTATHVPLMDGTYTAVATDLITGCQASVTTVVVSSSPAEVEAIVTTDFFADQNIIEVSAVGTGDYEYQLDDGPWQTSNTFIGVSPGYHIVTVRDINGCGTGTDQALVIDYPRFFTPNGDGYNDTWQIEGIQNRPLIDIYIFDRYGKLLKQLSPLGDGWDGTYNGKLMPSTDYWFTITLDILYGENESLIKTFKGHFSLKR